MTTQNLQVNASARDAVEAAGGTVSINSANDNIVSSSAEYGLKFASSAIPQAATITSAILECYCDNAAFDDPNFNIYGQAADSPADFTTAANDISSRPYTTANVLWSATGTGTGFIQSPDIKTVIQELVNRAGWNNLIVLILDANTGVNFKTNHYDGVPANAAKLTITYTSADNPSTPLAFAGLGWNTTQMMRSHDNQTDIGVPVGETFTTMLDWGQAKGVKFMCFMFGVGDLDNQQPGFEVRPGKFYWPGVSTNTRNANEDLTAPLSNLGNLCPGGSNMLTLLDGLVARDMKCEVRVGRIQDLMENFTTHPYNMNRRNAFGNLDGTGTPGVLNNWWEAFSNATARQWYKNRYSAFIEGLTVGGLLHEGIGIFDPMNEVLHWENQSSYDETIFFDWCTEIVDHIWTSIPGTTEQKPLVTLSATHTGLGSPNTVFEELISNGVIPAEKLMWGRHDYDAWHTSENIRREMTAIYMVNPSRPIGITENWAHGTGPGPVPTSFIDDLILDGTISPPTGVYDDPPDTETAPYAHTRIEAAILASLPQVAIYSRWPNQIDSWTGGGSSGGGSNLKLSYKRIVEVKAPVKELFNLAAGLYNRKKEMHGQIQSSGTLSFKSASSATKNDGTTYIFFCLRGTGTQTVDFNLPGTSWAVTTYDWDETTVTKVLNASAINPNAWSLAFGGYARNFVTGYLSTNANLQAVNAWSKASGQDGSETAGGTVDTSTAQPTLSSADAWYGFAMPNVTIPSGATITGAWIEMYFSDASFLVAKGIFYLEDTLSAANFSSSAKMSTRSTIGTTVTINQTLASTGWAAFDITAAFSAYYTAKGSLSNDKIGLLFKGTTGVTMKIRSFDYDSYVYSPRLVVQYTTAVAASSGLPVFMAYYRRRRA